MILAYDNSKEYKVDQSGDLFWHIFYYAQLNLLYIYPRFFHWLRKVITEMPTGNRIIFASYKESTNDLTGYMILKQDETEHKICTLQVFPKFRKQGFATELMKKALDLLKNPVLTVSDIQLPRYSGILSQYGFSAIGSVPGAYNDSVTEHVFQHTGG